MGNLVHNVAIYALCFFNYKYYVIVKMQTQQVDFHVSE